ncbi:MAG TPA: hypothetical protein VK364_08240, partial [Hymenobacter sp.]|nr:hypothetical protein [Hymenobacter sp.]
MENDPKPTTTDQLQSAKTGAAEKLEALKTEAGQHLNSAVAHLDELKDKLVAKAHEVGNDIDIEGLKAQATEQFEATKAA